LGEEGSGVVVVATDLVETFDAQAEVKTFVGMRLMTRSTILDAVL
jgi:hypothetical protein